MRRIAPWNRVTFRLWATLALVVIPAIGFHLWYTGRDTHLVDIAAERGRQMARLLQAHVGSEPGSGCMKGFEPELVAYMADSTIASFMIMRVDSVEVLAPAAAAGGDMMFRPCHDCHDEPGNHRTSLVRDQGDGVAPIILVAEPLSAHLSCAGCHPLDAAHQATLHLALNQSEAELTHVVARRRLVLAGTVVAGSALLLLAILVQVLVGRPLQKILAGVQRLESGDLSARVAVGGSEDFARLASAFNSMTAQLDQTYQRQSSRIEDQSRELATSQATIVHQEKLAGLGLMAAGVAHEIGNPLASISAVAQVLGRRSDDEFTQEQVKLILEHIDRITRIVRDLGDFSRPQSAVAGVCSVNEIVRTAITLLGHDRRFRNVKVRFQLEPDLPRAYAVPDHLMQIFFNLGLNALEAMDGQGDLTITTWNKGEAIRVRILDSGPGVPPEIASQVFDPFFTTKPKGKGTGLGLSVSYGLARSLGGDLELESGEGPGASFVVSIRVQPSVVAGSASTDKQSRPHSMAVGSTREAGYSI